jgi:YHS domain-containing protein
MKYLLLTACLLAGCASSSTQPIAASNNPQQQHDECLVCKMNVDLACVDVAVDKDTPTYNYLGRTYHFCSTDCRDKFAKDPAKYAGK